MDSNCDCDNQRTTQTERQTDEQTDGQTDGQKTSQKMKLAEYANSKQWSR